MEVNYNNVQINNDYQNLDMSEVVKKIRNRKQLIEFFFRLGWFFPNYPIFNYDFAFLFCKGIKKVRFN